MTVDPGNAAAPRDGGGQTSQLARSEARTAWLLMIPSFIVILVVALYPFAQVVTLSLTDARFATARLETSFVGLDNYRPVDHRPGAAAGDR